MQVNNYDYNIKRAWIGSLGLHMYICTIHYEVELISNFTIQEIFFLHIVTSYIHYATETTQSYIVYRGPSYDSYSIRTQAAVCSLISGNAADAQTIDL